MAESLGRKIYMILWLSLVMKNFRFAKVFGRTKFNFIEYYICNTQEFWLFNCLVS
jgi:hypothetical protein